MLNTQVSSTGLRTISPHFQRSINLTYDASNAEYVASYIPTPKGARALATILNNALENGSQRAHVLHAPYGSGKSLLGLVLSAVISQDPSCSSSLDTVQVRMERVYPIAAQAVQSYQATKQRLLPVILSGDEGSLSTALIRALTRSLASKGLGDLRPRTQFQAALETIDLWERSYPDVFQNLDARLVQENHTISSLCEDLEAIQPEALALFERLYPDMAAGARFDPYAGVSLADAFHDTAQALNGTKYDGFFIIWDEFGRFVEARASEAFGPEAAFLQSFAEFCNRSGSHQVHLVLITHRLLSGYAADLPTEYQQEWARIAERFQAHDVTSDPAVTYRLVSEAVETTDQIAWQQFAKQHQHTFNNLTAQSLELDLFEGLDDTSLRQQIIERVWPLHPLTVYALPRLANQVAQNERTLFTFLAADEPGTLQEKLARANSDWWMLRPDAIWDYFAEAVRLDVGPGGTHATWSGVMYALSKASSNDRLTQVIVKALGVLTIVGDVNVQSQTTYGRITPTTELLAWASGTEEKEVASCLQRLKRRRAVAFRHADGYWTFTRGSDVDLDAEIAAAIERNTPSPIQIRQLLERDAPAPFHLPRSYNQERGMTRYFWGLYRWLDDLGSISETFLKQLGPDGYADGVVAYVLTTNSVERNQAIQLLENLSDSRVIYVIPERPLLIKDALNELFALHDMQNDAAFMHKDERLPNEVAFFIEDAQRRLIRALQPLLDPMQRGASWWWHDGSKWRSERVKGTKDVSRLLSRLCTQWFNQTPILNNESLNQQEPTRLQINAAIKVIDALLSHQSNDEDDRSILPLDLNLTGYGPDFLIMRTMLIQSGLLKPISDEYGVLERPSNSETLAIIWDEVQEYLRKAMENERDTAILIDKLQSPPFGLRRGVLPVLLAAMMWPRSRVLTIRHKGKAISPLTGKAFTDLCWRPREFTIEVGPWDRRHAALWAVLEERCQSFLMPQEREHQPLSYLSRGLLRWLQARPRYCRDTNRISQDARQLRTLIYDAQSDPARVLFYDLLALLDNGQVDPHSSVAYQEMLATQLAQLIDEIDMAYQALLYDLDRFAEESFANDAPARQLTGKAALNFWMAGLEQQSGKTLSTFRFSDHLAQRLVATVRSGEEIDSFWDGLSEAVLGLHLQDWNDRSLETFKNNLLEAKERLEREIFELTENESAIELHVVLPEEGKQTYRFRPSDLSPHGQRILQNFKSTLEIAGRPLSPDERRQVVLALLHHVLEEPKSNNERRRKKKRRQQ
ncbi:MAG: hypothetical protein CL608_26205 [Anaerolineaceae bacterium]|nr:hypothetical protein [Anaerolineaceae bacterium]